MAGIDDNVGTSEKHSSDINGGIDKLPDDVLINILSRTSLKEAMRASVLGCRWRYLWRFFNGTLQFDQRDTVSGNVMEREKFESWVNNVVELHLAQYVEGIVISLEATRYHYWINGTTYGNLVHFAGQKEVGRFELSILSRQCKFPSVERLISLYDGVMSSPFSCLRTLRLASVNVEDEVVHYFLTSCPNLEELCIHNSDFTKNLRVMDPPCLRVLEISKCICLQCLEISAVDLVSLTYTGAKNSLVLKKIPNLRELTIRGDFCKSFVIEPKELYSVQLEKPVLDFQILGPFVVSCDLPLFCSLKRLDVQVFVERLSIFFLTSFVKACSQSCEIRIELKYVKYHEIIYEEANVIFVRRNPKEIEVVGYIGYWKEKELLLALIEMSPSIERVVIDTESQSRYYDYSARRRDLYCATARDQARRRAKLVVSKFPR